MPIIYGMCCKCSQFGIVMSTSCEEQVCSWERGECEPTDYTCLECIKKEFYKLSDNDQQKLYQECKERIENERLEKEAEEIREINEMKKKEADAKLKDEKGILEFNEKLNMYMSNRN